MTILVICALVFVLILTLLFTSVHINFSYDEKYILNIKYGFLTVYKNQNKIQSNTEEKNTENEPEFELKKIKSIFNKTKKILKHFHNETRKHFKIANVTFRYNFGFSDAALTGIYSGIAYSVIYSLIGYIDSAFRLKNHEVEIKPDFDNVGQHILFECSCNIKLIYLLKSGIKILKIWLK